MDYLQTEAIMKELVEATGIADKSTWSTMIDDPREFMLIDKNKLSIDHEYQRQIVSRRKVMDIAKNFNWGGFGALSVAQHKNKSYWVYDGGNRLRAAMLREEIEKVPCLVIKVNNNTEAATFFGLINVNRDAVSQADMFRADFIAGKKDAIDASKILHDNGYTVSTRCSGDGAFNAIACLRALTIKDCDLAAKVFAFCADAAGGQAFPQKALTTVFEAAKHCRVTQDIDIFDARYTGRVLRAGMPKLISELDTLILYVYDGKNNPRNLCQAFITYCNKLNNQRSACKLEY